MKIGIVGLPNVGKSTLFNSITNSKVEMANYPFCTIEPNVGIVNVPDERLDNLQKLYNSKRKVPAIIEFVDIAGLVKGASKGEGLGNKFLSHIREVDAIIQVVRCFENSNIIHVDGNVDPIRDIEVINMELALADIETISKRLQKLVKQVKENKEYQKEIDFLNKIQEKLNEAKNIKNEKYSEDEKKILSSLCLLSMKPTIYVANIEEKDIAKSENEYTKKVEEYAKSESSKVVILCVKTEEEISKVEEDEKKEMLELFGLKQSGIDKLIVESYSLLGLMSFLTAGEDEVRAWTIKKGTTAKEAAGKIHSDIERGFIMADVISYPDLMQSGSIAEARKRGLLRMEGKDYIMQDNDIVEFKFNI